MGIASAQSPFDGAMRRKALDKWVIQARVEIDRCESEEVILDCASISMINSDILDRLIRLHLTARQREIHIVLTNVSELVFRTLSVTRLDRMLDVRIDERHKQSSGPHDETDVFATGSSH